MRTLQRGLSFSTKAPETKIQSSNREFRYAAKEGMERLYINN
jgi:hypothetical protein